jgi:hypothetical protein
VSFRAQIISCYFAMSWTFYTSSPFLIVLLHFEKDNKHGLSNPLGLGLVACCWEERNEFHQCKIPNTSWILDSKEPFVGLQNLCDNDLYVWWRLFEQFTTASKKQSMANIPNKSKLQNSTIKAVWLSIGICVSK